MISKMVLNSHFVDILLDLSFLRVDFMLEKPTEIFEIFVPREKL